MERPSHSITTHWYVSRTLGGFGVPDINKRFIHHGLTQVAVFNEAMREWLPEDDMALSQVVGYLNRMVEVER